MPVLLLAMASHAGMEGCASWERNTFHTSVAPGSMAMPSLTL